MGVERIAIEVACAEAERQTVVALEVPSGCTAGEAVELSGILGRHPDLDVRACAVGIFGQEVPAGRVLRPGDRVEVLRPLTEDPRERRRRLAREGRSMKSGSAGGG
ncbi:MAG TPA: RnfH family protein [Steroidobacteraceae bacterium]|nr:RnfH family protein [Steroidobacteraceae bacterium]